MRALKIGAVAVLLLATSLVVFCRVAQAHYTVPVLMYHQVRPDATLKTPLAVTPETFEKQMAFLRSRGYTVMPLAELAARLRNGAKIAPGTVAITFDDGNEDNYQYAFPVLLRYRIPATMFIIVNEVGRPQNDRLTWTQIRRMQASGLVTIGSHTMGPEPLVNIASADEVRRQIVESKAALERTLSLPVTLFSYPEGMFTPAIRQEVIDAGYAAAVGTKTVKGYPADDVYVIKRLRISENARNMGVFWFETSGWYTFVKENKRKK